jgi:hypothetical protein
VKYSLSSITAAYQEEGSHDNEEDEDEELTPSVNLSRIDMEARRRVIGLRLQDLLQVT